MKSIQRWFQMFSKEWQDIRKSRQMIRVWVTYDQTAGQIQTTSFKMGETESVYEIKVRIQARWQIPITQQRLTLLGRFKSLNDSDTLAELRQSYTHLNALHVECVSKL